MKASFLELNEGGQIPRFDSLVMVDALSDFALIMLLIHYKNFLHNGHKHLYMSHPRGKKNSLCQGTTHGNALNNRPQ